METLVSSAGAFGKEIHWMFLSLTSSLVSYSACFSGIWGCLCVLPNRSPNEAAVALHLTAQQRCTRPRDRAGFQTGLVILSYTPVIKHRLRLLDHHLPKKIPSFLFSTC